MSMKLSTFDGDGTETVLAKVLTNGGLSLGHSLYVGIPRFDKQRRTDGGATDHSTSTVEFEGEVKDYSRGDYVKLTFEPTTYGDKHVLKRVERATFTDPLNAPEPKFPNTDVPKTCPCCGREAAALVETEWSSTTGGKVSDTADACIVGQTRGAWLGVDEGAAFVHGTE